MMMQQPLMQQPPIASRTIDFERSLSVAELSDLLHRVVALSRGRYWHWSSVRSMNDLRYMRFGLKRRDYIGSSGDLLILPCDGQEAEWFRCDRSYGRVLVRTRVGSANLIDQLYDQLSVEKELIDCVDNIAEQIKAAEALLNETPQNVSV